jgi:hypothetical protein
MGAMWMWQSVIKFVVSSEQKIQQFFLNHGDYTFEVQSSFRFT